MPVSGSGPQRRTTVGASRALKEMRRAERYAERGQVAEAIQSLESAIQYGADAYTCYLRQARLYQGRQQWAEAVVAAEKAIAERPEKISAREAIIALYLESRNYQRAADASRDLLKLSPRHVPARDALGAAYIGMGDVDSAMKVANELVRLDPNEASHHYKKALLCQHRGDVAIAVTEFARVVQLVPDTDLAESAQDQLESLDAFQLGNILTLAMEDTVFRAKIARDPEEAVAEKGFHISESGREILRHMAEDMLSEIQADGRISMYH
jgi:tetratricopeptide (TPR) repeat protein